MHYKTVFNFMSRVPPPASVFIHSVHKMEDNEEFIQDDVEKEGFVYGPLPPFVVQIGRDIVNKKGNCRKRKDDLMLKAVECCCGETDSIPVLDIKVPE